MNVNSQWTSAMALSVITQKSKSSLPEERSNERFEDPGYQSLGVEFWNTFMRLVIFQTVVLLLHRVRRENILFTQAYLPTRNDL